MKLDRVKKNPKSTHLYINSHTAIFWHHVLFDGQNTE